MTSGDLLRRLFLNRDDVLAHKPLQFSPGHLPSRFIQVQMVPEVAPSNPQLHVVLFVQSLEDFDGFGSGQNPFPFIRGSVHIFFFPNQSHFSFPIAFEYGLGFGRVFKDGGELANHLNDVVVVHRREV